MRLVLKASDRPHGSHGCRAAALACLVCLSGCIETTTYVSPSASGTVIDAVSHKPIQGASVSVDGHPGLFTQTNSAGEFLLAPETRKTRIFLLGPYKSLPPGGTVVVSAEGYAAREIVVHDRANALVVSLDRAR